MDDSQRERMQRSREAALLRRLARIGHKDNQEIKKSVACRPEKTPFELEQSDLRPVQTITLPGRGQNPQAPRITSLRDGIPLATSDLGGQFALRSTSHASTSNRTPYRKLDPALLRLCARDPKKITVIPKRPDMFRKSVLWQPQEQSHQAFPSSSTTSRLTEEPEQLITTVGEQNNASLLGLPRSMEFTQSRRSELCTDLIGENSLEISIPDPKPYQSLDEEKSSQLSSGPTQNVKCNLRALEKLTESLLTDSQPFKKPESNGVRNSMSNPKPLKSLEQTPKEIRHLQPTLPSILGVTKDPPDFDYLVVIDFECTCDKILALNPQEIIEFPAVLVNLKLRKLEGTFRTYVKPVCHPQLTEFCKRLTGIHQDQVSNDISQFDTPGAFLTEVAILPVSSLTNALAVSSRLLTVNRGVPLGKALAMHDAWLEEKGVKNNRFVVATWSDWDCKIMLESECKWKCLKKPPYFNRWINLKVPFQKRYGDIKTNLKGSLELTGRQWEGRQHCGLDDAKNTASLALELVKQGVTLKVTNSFKIYSSDGSKIPTPLLKKPKISSGNLEHVSVEDGVQELRGDFDESKLVCYCGVKSKKRLVKKPGPSHGRQFFSCGKWTITTGGKCNFFIWASLQTLASDRMEGT